MAESSSAFSIASPRWLEYHERNIHSSQICGPTRFMRGRSGTGPNLGAQERKDHDRSKQSLSPTTSVPVADCRRDRTQRDSSDDTGGRNSSSAYLPNIDEVAKGGRWPSIHPARGKIEGKNRLPVVGRVGLAGFTWE